MYIKQHMSFTVSAVIDAAEMRPGVGTSDHVVPKRVVARGMLQYATLEAFWY
jgi:hypothetical protein